MPTEAERWHAMLCENTECARPENTYLSHPEYGEWYGPASDLEQPDEWTLKEYHPPNPTDTT